MLLVLAVALAGSLMAGDAKESAFLSTYCITCHGPKSQMADRRFDQIRLPPADADTVIALQDILDKMNAGAMPPRAAKQPPTAERQQFVDSLTSMIAESEAAHASTGGHTVL